MKKTSLIVLFILALIQSLPAEESSVRAEALPLNIAVAEDDACRAWVDSVFHALDFHARVGQLFMPCTVPEKEGGAWYAKMCRWVRENKIGGLYFSSGNVYDQVLATDACQRIAAETGLPPVLFGADAEWGLAMRLPGTIAFPHNTMLGAVQDTALLVELGREMARQCKRVGVQLDFGPVADVNSNPSNPIINVRSFGSDAKEVAWRTSAFVSGLSEGHVLAVAKHFPGHGNTAEDSHLQLAKVSNSRQGLDTTELLPFRALIDEGLEGIMVGHLSVPALDTVSHLPSSQSPLIVDGLLRQELGFDGLAITDAMEMKGASAGSSGLNCIRALQAGNDILLKPVNLPADMRAVEEAVKKGLLTEDMINEKCRKVLTYKYRLGLSETPLCDTAALMADLHTPAAEALCRRLNEGAMTLLRNENDFLPLRHLESLRTAVILLGQAAPQQTRTPGGAPRSDNPFARMLQQYQEDIDIFYLTPGGPLDREDVATVFSGYDRVVVGVYDHSALQRKWVNRLKPLSSRLCLTLFSSPYTLASYGGILETAASVLLAYESTPCAQEAAAEALMGGIAVNGKLPCPIGRYYARGAGLETDKCRLSYGWPEQEGLSSDVLSRVDTLMATAIDTGAIPGGQLLVARNGRVIWNKAYGFTDVWNKRPVETTDIYDLASLTKAVVTTPAVMTLYETEKIKLTDPVANYVEELNDTDKASATYLKMLWHEARLVPYIGFYRHLIDTASLAGQAFATVRCDEFHTERLDADAWVMPGFRFSPLVSATPSDSFPLQVAEGMYVHASFRDSVAHIIAQSSLRRRAGYCYSDLGFILMGFAAEKVMGKNLDRWAAEDLYAPLGAVTTGYHPLDRFPEERIVPTALDTVLRHQLLRGYPHDEAAAFLGGVSGNAGLFSSASDLAKYLQMLLWQGSYGNQRFFEPSTVRYFTGRRSRASRRMLGFDAAEPVASKIQPTSEKAPKATYGHTGFTGTCFWVDPVNHLVLVFLTNRIHPDRTNQTMLKMDLRTRLQDAVYDALTE